MSDFPLRPPGHKLEDEGTVLPVRPFIDFQGGGVTATDDPGNNRTVVTVAAGAGGVTSVTASSPLSSSGGTTPVISVANQAANTALMGPTSGGSAAPTFRAITDGDMPTTAVSAASYPSSAAVVPTFTVNANGRLTAAGSQSLTSLVGSAAPASITGGAQTESGTAAGAIVNTPATWGTGTLSTSGSMLNLQNNGTTRLRFVDDNGAAIMYLSTSRTVLRFIETSGSFFSVNSGVLYYAPGGSINYQMTSTDFFPQSSGGASLGSSQPFSFGRFTTRLEVPTIGPSSSVQHTLPTDVSATVVTSRSGTVQTTDATVTTALTITPTANTTIAIEATVVGHKSDHSQGASYRLIGTVRTTGGASNLVGTVVQVSAQEDDAAWDATIDVSGATARVRVTGNAGDTVNWTVRAIVTQAS